MSGREEKNELSLISDSIHWSQRLALNRNEDATASCHWEVGFSDSALELHFMGAMDSPVQRIPSLNQWFP